jgi:NTP pyrophosphatase (non-canonical NTP hydrolase)
LRLVNLNPGSLVDLDAEVCRARKKLPNNRLLLAALMEEAGELAQALLQRQGTERVGKEALQVACVAMRIYEEGDSTFADVTDEEAKP